MDENIVEKIILRSVPEYAAIVCSYSEKAGKIAGIHNKKFEKLNWKLGL